MDKYGTKFQETEAILAAQEGDTRYLSEVLAEMLPGERARLGEAALALYHMVDDPLVFEAQERLGLVPNRPGRASRADLDRERLA